MTSKKVRSKFKRFHGPLIFVSLALFSISLAGASTVAAESRAVRLKQAFRISLESNPTTGYKWSAEFDRSLLQLKGVTYNRDSSKPKKMMGVGGAETFVFVPIKPGGTTINFQYKRPWEKNKKPVRTKIFSIVISP